MDEVGIRVAERTASRVLEGSVDKDVGTRDRCSLSIFAVAAWTGDRPLPKTTGPRDHACGQLLMEFVELPEGAEFTLRCARTARVEYRL